MDLRSTRQHGDADTAATEPREQEMSDADLRSARLQQDTSSAEAEHPADKTADTDLRSTRPQQYTDLDTDELTSQRPPETGESDSSNFERNDTIVPNVSDKGNDDTVVEKKKSPRGGKYNLRPNLTPNLTGEYSYGSEQVI